MFLKIKFNKYDLRDIGRKGLIQQIENMFHVQQARRSFQKILSTLLGHTDSFIKFRTIAIIEILFCGCYAIKYRFKGKHTKNNNSSKYAIDLQLAPHSLSALFHPFLFISELQGFHGLDLHPPGRHHLLAHLALPGPAMSYHYTPIFT